MTSAGSNLYQVTLHLKSNQNIEYLFVNGVGPTKEALDPSWTCTNGNTQYTNRLSALAGSDTTICFLWSTCTSCGTSSVNQVSKDDIKLSLSKEGIRFFSNTISEADQLAVFDLMGRTIYFSDKISDIQSLIPMTLNSGSMYLITMKVNSQTLTFKGIVMN